MGDFPANFHFGSRWCGVLQGALESKSSSEGKYPKRFVLGKKIFLVATL
jgi:hypothetical protein